MQTINFKELEDKTIGELRRCGNMLCNPESHNPESCRQQSHTCGFFRLCSDCEKLKGGDEDDKKI